MKYSFKIFSKTICSKCENTAFVLIRDKLGLVNKVKDFDIPYLPKLNLENNFQYGMELEFDEASLVEITTDIKQEYNLEKLEYQYNWYVKEEETITDFTKAGAIGGEVVAPISHNTLSDWQELHNICQIIKDSGGVITDNCAFHVHVDFDKLDLTIKQWTKFLKLWVIYENVIYKFGIGEQQATRSCARTFAKPLRDIITNSNAKNIEYWLKQSDWIEKNYSLRLSNLAHRLSGEKCELPTIEFRLANGTLNKNMIQNYIRCYHGLLKAAKSNDAIVNYYIDNNYDDLPEASISAYQFVDYDKALELVDIIFDNNFDKCCFLKQYFKEEDYPLANMYYKKKKH